MTREIPNPPAANRGSRRWLQILVNCRPELLNGAIGQRLCCILRGSLADVAAVKPVQDRSEKS